MRYFAGDTLDVWGYIKDKRDAKLQGCDWTQLPDSPLSDSKKAEWATYRQALRDMSATYDGKTTVTDIPFPNKPS